MAQLGARTPKNGLATVEAGDDAGSAISPVGRLNSTKKIAGNCVKRDEQPCRASCRSNRAERHEARRSGLTRYDHYAAPNTRRRRSVDTALARLEFLWRRLKKRRPCGGVTLGVFELMGGNVPRRR